MREEWWEKPACWLCDYWWVVLLILILGLLLIFTRDIWLEELGFQPDTPTPTITQVIPTETLSPTATPEVTVTHTLEPMEINPEITLGTGDVQVTLTWHTNDDLDLWVYDPEGALIYYSSPYSSSGGELDVDANLGCSENITYQPVENIFWPEGEAPFGEYKVEVDYFENCGTSGTIEYIVTIKVDGTVNEYSGTFEYEKDHEFVQSFTR